MSLKKKVVFLPYDFDTAIGINNEGALVFSYNLEDIDKINNGTADVFNGQQSVLWKNLRETYADELAAMYKDLRQQGVISYDIVENMFETHQAKWPEAIFNEDAQFKYLDPLINDGNASYLDMCQGSKAEQRKWWLYNRFKYIDSKYNAGDALTDTITIRCYALGNISITPYADIYAAIKYGSALTHSRANRNEAIVIPCPLDQMNDTEVYIYSASQIASVGDLSPMKVGYAEFARATKLLDLKLGDKDPNYTNGNLTALYLGNNTLLRTIDVRNCPNLTQAVDLSGCSNIEEIYFDGTSITGLSLPNGGHIHTLHLPATVSNLTIRNQAEITDFVLPSYNNITTVRIENTPSVDTREILETIPANSRVRLLGIDWTVEDEDELTALYAKFDTMRGLDEHDNNVATAQLSGNIYIPDVMGETVNDCEARYPDIDISFDHCTAYIKYYNYDGSRLLYTENITGGKAGEYAQRPTREADIYNVYTFAGWSRKPNGPAEADAQKGNLTGYNLYAAYNALPKFDLYYFSEDGGVLYYTEHLINSGSTGVYMGKPTKKDDNDWFYEFDGWATEMGGEADPNAQKNVTITRVLYAAYRKIPKVHVYYFNDDGTELIYTENMASGSNATYNVPAEKEATAKYTYTFLGWSTMPDGPIDNTVRQNVTMNLNLFAVFRADINSYRVRYYNGTALLETDYVNYGEDGYYNGITPSHENPELEFNGWLPEPTNITGDLDCYAQFTDTRNQVARYLRRTITSYYSDTDVLLDNTAFVNCTELTEITSAAGVAQAGAFTGCSSLEKVTFTNFIDIAAGLFYNCIKLKHLILSANTKCTLTDRSAFNSTAIEGGFGAIYVPENLVAEYRADANWSHFIIAPISSYPIEDFEGGGSLTDTWADILASELDGTYKNKYHVGDTKKIMSNGYIWTMAIHAFDADDLADGSGKAPISWVSVDVPKSYRMNANNTTAGGWEDSLLRGWLNDEILPDISNTMLRNGIKSVKRAYHDHKSDSTKVCNDKLSIPSLAELGYSGSYYVNCKEDSGTNYTAYYGGGISDSSNTSYAKKYNGVPRSWWTRTSANDVDFCYILQGGSVSRNGATGEDGVVLEFCT